MELLYVLLVLLAATRLFGELAVRLGQPVLIGELIAGIAIGLAVQTYSGTFPILATLSDDEVFVAITDLGIFFLMLLAGLELRPDEVAQASRRAVGVAIGGMLLPLGLGMGLGYWLLPHDDLLLPRALFLGVALSITAVPVSVKVLMDLGLMESRTGTLIVSAAIMDDVLSLVLLAVLTAVLRTGSMPGGSELALLAAEVVGFFVVAVGVGRWLVPRIGAWVGRARVGHFEFSFVLLMALLLGVIAENMGMHFIVGAFFAGLFFVRSTIDARTYDRVTEKLRAITVGFLAPVFFASIGLHLEPAGLSAAPLFLVALLVAATLGKVVGSGVAARAAGLPGREAAAVGVGMNGRGAVELIVADVALAAGLFETTTPSPVVDSLYASVVIMAIVTTLVTPIGLRALLRKRSGGADP